MKTYFKTELGVLYHGDCLEILPQLGAVDVILTDPPYSSGGQFRGDRNQKTSIKYVQTGSVETCKIDFQGDSRDQRAFLAWSTMWLSKMLQIATPGAVLMTFTDWRQLPTLSDAIQCGGWVWRNIVTWWKPGIRMQRGRFSSSAEYVLYASNGIPQAGSESPQNVLQYQPVPGIEKEHIAEKPIELIRTLLGVSSPGSTVLDSFAGSGSTPIACELLGLKWVAIEISEKQCEIAAKRIERERQQLKLFPPVEMAKPVQGGLF